MPNRVYAYVAATALGALLLIALLPWTPLLTIDGRDAAGLAAFIAVAILSEAMAIEFSIGPNHRAKSSVAFLPLFACAILFQPIAALLGVLLVQSFTELLLRERVFWRGIFNVSQSALSIGVSSAIYHLFRTPSSDTPLPILAFATFVTTSFALNVAIVSGLYAIRAPTPQPYLRVLRQIVGPKGNNLVYDFLASPVALVAAILYREFYIGGLLMLILPLLLIRYSYLSKLQLQQANRDLLRVLIKAIETRDPYTSGHSLRVSQLARLIAEDLRLRARQVEQIETAALLHDIGKIETVYSEIIQKPSGLTDEERRVLQSHAVRGAAMLETLSTVDAEIVRGVRHHHERYDGTGYPDGLAGKAIPLTARIIMLSDSIDAMLSDRPYRSALTIDQARIELLRCAGTQFDPDIVEIILRRNTLERAASLADRAVALQDRAGDEPVPSLPSVQPA